MDNQADGFKGFADTSFVIDNENKTLTLKCSDDLFKTIVDLLEQGKKKKFDILFIAKVLKMLKPFLEREDEPNVS